MTELRLLYSLTQSELVLDVNNFAVKTAEDEHYTFSLYFLPRGTVSVNVTQMRIVNFNCVRLSQGFQMGAKKER